MTKYTYIVPTWAKVAFFWLAIVLGLLLIGMQLYKRWLFAELLVENALRPEPSALVLAPNFELKALPEGTKQSLNAAAGQYALVHFWATWCPPCRAEMPSLDMMGREFSGRLKVFAISVDEDPSALGRFFGEQWPKIAVLWDPQKAIAKLYGAERFPESFLIDPKGNVIAHFGGPREWATEAAWHYLSEVLDGKRRALTANRSPF
jgi:thiol-disulfide isomerase/thioredoxin